MKCWAFDENLQLKQRTARQVVFSWWITCPYLNRVCLCYRDDGSSPSSRTFCDFFPPTLRSIRFIPVSTIFVITYIFRINSLSVLPSAMTSFPRHDRSSVPFTPPVFVFMCPCLYRKLKLILPHSSLVAWIGSGDSLAEVYHGRPCRIGHGGGLETRLVREAMRISSAYYYRARANEWGTPLFLWRCLHFDCLL